MVRKVAKTAAKDKDAAKRPKTAAPSAQVPPVVCLGASAGGLKALSAFLDNIPSGSDAAYVVVHHADPEHKSLLAELLAKHTDMVVAPAVDQTCVQAGHVYVIPPNRYLEIKDGILHLFEQDDRRGTRLPIDRFLRSLADDRGQHAVAVILSGAGSDGASAIRAVKEQGGIVIVQDPQEADHDGMPRSAIASGAADHVLPVAKMPDVITAYLKHPVVLNTATKKAISETARGLLPEFTAALRTHAPINFDYYKEGTLLRRIERRMALRHMENARDYLALLKDSPQEGQDLGADMLISVTSFFRDPEVFAHFEKTLLEDIVKAHDAGHPLRVWVPGCATGEEAYTLAIILIEKISGLRKNVKLQIFASDVDEPALAIARAGVYPDSIAEDVSPERLKRFFIKEDHSYRVTPELRDTIVFANQNLLADAPFSKIDLVSCRNLMIYLTPEAQQRVLHIFHFALKKGGLLLLGMSETAGNSETIFEPLSKKLRIYKRIGDAHARSSDFPFGHPAFAGVAPFSARISGQTFGNKLADLSQRLLIEHYAPAAVLINDRSETLYFEGPTDRYLRVPSGESNRDLLAMARQGLKARLGSAIRSARQTGEPVGETARVTRDDVRILVRIDVIPVTLDDGKMFLVTFADEPVVTIGSDQLNGSENRQLEQELETIRADLRQTIRDYERSTEELKAANEEAMSMNEEFQSTNEELETSKEELQSLNEELTTLNTQLQQKIDDERRISDDLNNLLASSGIATLFLDADRKIMRFTPATRDLFNLITNDIGRPFSDITGKVSDPDLLGDVDKVLKTLAPIKCEIQGQGARWYMRKILPYRTQSGKIDGVVITFVEVTELKTLQRETAAARAFLESVVNTLREPLIVLDGNLTILSVSRSFHKMFGTTQSDIVNHHLFSIQDNQWDVPKLRALLEAVLPRKTTMDAFNLTLQTGNLGQRDLILNARRIEDGPEAHGLILLAIEDETERKKAEQSVLDREARLSAILDAVPEAIVTTDENGMIGTFSTGAQRMFGYQATEVVGKTVSILMPEPDHSKHDSYIKDYVETGKKKALGLRREMIARRKDGNQMPVRVLLSELQLDGARHFLAILQDLTADKKRQAELQRAQKMEAVGQLTGGIAHDFNNLLTVVIGNLELMEMRTKDPQLLELLQHALEASNLGATLTSHLLSFSKSQSLAPEPVDLNCLVKVMLPMVERTIGEQIKVETRLADDLHATLADPGQIESAILNLAINSRDAMPEGGTLSLDTRNVVLDADYAMTQVDVKPGDYVCLSVTDTGAGMPDDVRPRVFEPFFTTKGPGGGSGLGLSMVYGFAKQSGGNVAIYSEVGQGTTVSLFLPVALGGIVSKKASPKEQICATRNETILVVEDDPKVRQLTVTRLEELKYRVLAAANGTEAMTLLKQHDEIDLVLTDVVMPGGMTGFDVAEKARALRPDIKIILTTGYAKAINGQDESGGETDYPILRKPYGLQELSQALRNHLD